jgi:hypothetical protein
LHKCLILLFFFALSTHAIDYGKVRIKLPESQYKDRFSFAYLIEQSNDLIDSNAVEASYLHQISGQLSLGASFTSFSSSASETGLRVKEDLSNNGIIQKLELKKFSLMVNSNYRIASGVMKFVGKYQALTFIDFGLGLGVAQYEYSDNKETTTKKGISYSLELGSHISKKYLASIIFKKAYDGIGDDTTNNQSYLGLKVGVSW